MARRAASAVHPGAAGRVRRYSAAAAEVRGILEELGLRLLLPPELRSNTITTARLPVVSTQELRAADRQHGGPTGELREALLIVDA
jgi:aspartate aminotransferase-like enzyme